MVIISTILLCMLTLFISERIVKHYTKKLASEIRDEMIKIRYKAEELERDCGFYHSSLEYICEEIEEKIDNIVKIDKDGN